MTYPNITTKEDYKLYEDHVQDFLKSEGINSLSAICDEDNDYEEYFSWKRCDCCNRNLGGNRIDCNAWCEASKEINEYSVCIDCFYYAEYGQLDDTTMMNINS